MSTYSTTYSSAGNDAVAGVLLIIYLIVILVSLICAAVCIVSMWKIFQKAGEPGWKSIIPFYNNWVLCDLIFSKNIVWFILQFVPYANFVAMIAIQIALAKAFGKGCGFGILGCFFPIVTLPILAFGSAEYQGKPA